MNVDIIKAVFAAVDSRDPGALIEFLTPDARFRFANQPVIEGREAVQEMLVGFYDYVKGLRHEIIGIHPSGDVWAVETVPHYVDAYGRSFNFPACNLFTVRGDKISEYKIFVDNSAMFSPPAEA